MKQCPRCGHLNDDATDFCIDDGTRLVSTGNQGQSRVVVSWDDQLSVEEIPTQYVSIPQQPAKISSSTPNWLYVLTGGLVAVVLMGGAILVYLLSRDQPVDQQRTTANVTSNVPSAGMANSTQNPTNAAQPGANAMANAANTAANAPVAPRNAPPRRPARQFSATYVGNIGDNGVEMDLRRNGTTLSGTVRPYGNSADIYVNGYIDDDGSFSMDETSDIGVVTGVYRGWLRSDGTINGSWSKPGGDRSRSISLRRR